MNQFVHLHLHSQYSMLDGVNKIASIVQLALQHGQPAVAVTDHGNMHGAVEFYLEAKKAGIKPILGCELYVTDTYRTDRRPKAQGGGGIYHLTALAQNKTGYQNLCRLVTAAHREGFYFKPRVDHELLAQYSEGLVVLSGCLAGELSGFIEYDDIERARKLLEFYATHFKDRFYLEIQPHPIPEQQKLNQACLELGTSMGLPLVATTDCHYPTEHDHYAQEVLMCISTGKQITDPTRLRHEGLTLHLKSAAEMLQEFTGFSNINEALANTVRIAESVEFEFDFSRHYMPRFMPDEKNSDTPLIEIMAAQARKGLAERLAELGLTGQDKVYTARLETEIQLIDKMGFAGYFLVVSDFIVWAKNNGIPVGPGRGSAAGSLVAYALRITEIDPITNRLLFERFLNPERVSLPDIDVDFCIHGRDKVIKYVIDKYGKENVAQIATFGTLKAKAAIKDVGRALGISYVETDKVAQLIPAPRQGFDFSITESLKMEPRLAEYAQGEGKELISLAMKLEGLTRHTSTHAAGVVIGDRPLHEMLPMMVDKDGFDVTQYSMTYVEKIGLVKFDFLGLKTLTMINTALAIIKESRGIELDINKLPLNDRATYALLGAGNTTGLFQLESSGITEMTIRLKPSCFDDIVAILSLYRPGPLDAGMVDHYIARKNGKERVAYLHPLMESSLSDTYGIIVYQEQIMQLARELAGYTLAEADILRKAMGKKNPEEMAKQRARFLSGASANKISEQLANEIFDQMETFARYGFNRSHSAAYALISFQTAFLKAHYPVEFMAALMSHEMSDSDKVLKNFTECRRRKIKVLPPDINESISGFCVRAGAVRYGLEAVKGIGERVVSSILGERANGEFTDFADFLMRAEPAGVNRKSIESLIKCGAFDRFGQTRRALFESLEDAIKRVASQAKERATGQISLFGSASTNGPAGSAPYSAQAEINAAIKELPEWPANQRLSFERDALGFYLTGHPLERFERELKRLGTKQTSEVRTCRGGSEVRVAGVITALKLRNTKKGDRYGVFSLEDSIGSIETFVWPESYKKFSEILATQEPILVTGKVDLGDERCNLVANDIQSLVTATNNNARSALLELREGEVSEQQLEKIQQLFREHRGQCPVQAELAIGNSKVALNLKFSANEPVRVAPSEALTQKVEQIIGRAALTFF